MAAKKVENVENVERWSGGRRKGGKWKDGGLFGGLVKGVV